MESIFSLDHFSTIAADLHYVLLLGQPLPEFPCTAWHVSSQPAPSVPLILSQHVLLVCQNRFFTDLISTGGLGVRGGPSGKTEILHSIVALPE